MKNSYFSSHTVVASILTVLLVGCAGQPSPEDVARATEGYVEDVNKLFVVDCLLPGQVRRLGTQMTYLTQRRPVRTTAADCEIRGGEYVAYDRANIATSLGVWLPKAEEGDTQAQLYIGEIYEKGVGRQGDYQAAAKWYRKAAEKGNSQAQINLGHLYEKGLGVPKDMTAALDWYRKASGLETANLQFATAVAPAPPPAVTAPEPSAAQQEEIQSLRREAERSRAEAEALRAQLRDTQQQLLDQQDSLRKSQEELDSLRQRLQQQKAQPAATVDDSVTREMERQLREKEAELKYQQSKLTAMGARLKQERQRMKTELAVAREAKPRPAVTAARQDNATGQAREQLQSAENALASKVDAYQTNAAELTQLLTRPGTGDEAAVRRQIEERKQQLQKDAMEIASLKEKVEQQGRKLAEGEKAGIQLATGPNIEILEPQIVQTRGMPTIQLRADISQVVGRVQAPDGLRSFTVNGQAQTVDSTGMFRKPIAGDSAPLRMIAIDSKNRQTDLTVTLLQAAVPDEAAPASTVAGAKAEQFADIDFGQFYALIVGNNDYASYPTLKSAVNDARSVEVILRERYGFKTKLLLNANRYTLMTALNELNKKLTDQDNLLIYYAGHGEIDPGTQSAYWLPTDAEKGNPANWVSSQSITDLLSIMPARHILVVADSCYSGALTGSAVAKLPEGMDLSKREKWLKIMNTRKARTVLTSGGVKPVLDEGGSGHSIFANAFLKILRSNQKVLEDYEIFRAVASQVRSGASRVGFEQSPQYAPLQHAGHEGSPFFLVPESV